MTRQDGRLRSIRKTAPGIPVLPEISHRGGFHGSSQRPSHRVHLFVWKSGRQMIGVSTPWGRRWLLEENADSEVRTRGFQSHQKTRQSLRL